MHERVKKKMAGVLRGVTKPKLTGRSEEFLLLSIFRRKNFCCGRDIQSEMKKTLDRDISVGAMYSTLDRLEKKGLVTSEEASENGGRLKLYFTVTGQGMHELNRAKMETDRMWDGVTEPLG